MPIYEYACTACGHQLEALQKISEDPLRKCPECGEDTLTKQISKVAFQLKGTGWYETDFKNKKKPADKDKAKDGDTTKGDGDSKKEPTSDTTTKADSSNSSSSEKKSKAAGD